MADFPEQSVILRSMREEDLDEIMVIEASAPGNPWSRESMEKELVNPQAHYLTAVLCTDGREDGPGGQTGGSGGQAHGAAEVAGTEASGSGEVVGYAGYWQVMDEGHIMNIAVREDLRSRGIGHALMEAMLKEGDSLGILYWTLEVRVSNAPALHLYEKTGFTSAGIRPGYYSNPKEDANILWLSRSV